MQKFKVSEIALELGMDNKDVIEKSKEIGIELKSANSAVTDVVANMIFEYISEGKLPVGFEKPKSETVPAQPVAEEAVAKSDEKTVAEKTGDTPKMVDGDRKIESSETLSSVGIIRTGIKVVQRATPKETPIAPNQQHAHKNIAELSLKELLSSTYEQTNAQKVQPKPKKKVLPSAHDHGKRIEVSRDLIDNTPEEDEQEIVLKDLSELMSVSLKEDAPAEERKTIFKKANPYDPSQNRSIRRGKRRRAPRTVSHDNSVVTSIVIPEDIRLYELADYCKKTPADLIKILFLLGKLTTKNDFLDKDDVELITSEFGITVTYKDGEDLDYVSSYDDDEEDGEDERPPIITIMGHVDHGKTSLLDRIRNTKIANGEAGGITQHIGAYQVTKNGKAITFIDTPGHEAFSAMRARGASITDIVIIVVAADDGVKPQTKEAISHAKAAGVPIIVAVNKIDKPTANMENVKTQMANEGILAVDWGGEFDFVAVSAHTGAGIDELLETILVQADLLELKGNKGTLAKGIVVESYVEKGKGPVATVIIQNGTLKIGDTMVCDTTYGKVRGLSDDMGKALKTATLSDAIQVQGLSDVPPAGSVLIVLEDEKEAREIAAKRAEAKRAKELSKSTKVSIDELGAMVAEGKIKTLPVVIKTDVQGSLEAIKSSLEKLKNEEVRVNIIYAGVGGITESDVTLASASDNCIILGFNVRPTGIVKEKAKKEGVEIKTYSVIYALIEEVSSVLSGLMSPIISEENTGQADVRDTFSISGVGTIAGCFVSDGTIIRGGFARVIRNGIVVHDNARISSLKRFKDDAREVGKGYECGIMIDGYNDVKAGDVIETFKKVESQAKL